MVETLSSQKSEKDFKLAQTSIRMPKVEDGKHIHVLVKKTSVLDVNSEYVYLLLGTHFQQSCAVVEVDSKLVGFVSAYIPPNQPDILFVWQVAVDKAYRKRKLAIAMLKEIIHRPFCRNIKYIHSTIAPSNFASRSLFMSLARYLDAGFYEQPMFKADCFSCQHEDELLFTIGSLVRP